MSRASPSFSSCDFVCCRRPTAIFSLSFEAHLKIAGSRRQITRLAKAGDQQRDYLWIKTKIKDVDFCLDGKQAPSLIQFTT
jgi:hypothetical protein